MPVLEVDGLTKSYGDVLAVADLSVALEAGETLVLLGKNGAGKTTALRCMAGVLEPTAGCVRVHGLDSRQRPDEVRAEVGLVPEVPGLYDRMPAGDYLDHFGRLYGIATAERAARIGELLDRFDLASAGRRWLGSYSKGMRQKVALMRATLHKPRLVLADEPTSALDPDSKRVAWRYLEELREAGASLVVCTHDMDEAAALAGRVGVMARGRLLAEGTVSDLIDASGLERRQETVERPSLEEIYVAIVADGGRAAMRALELV
jgi:ABC-type multidrug transport system ATPase subunit